MYKKYWFQLEDKPKYKPCRNFVCNDLAEKIVKTLKTDRINTFRRN